MYCLNKVWRSIWLSYAEGVRQLVGLAGYEPMTSYLAAVRFQIWFVEHTSYDENFCNYSNWYSPLNYKSSLLSPKPIRKKITNVVLYRKKYLAAVGFQIWFVELTSYDENFCNHSNWYSPLNYKSSLLSPEPIRRKIMNPVPFTKEIFGSSGIWTHAPKETGALNQRLRLFGYATLQTLVC